MPSLPTPETVTILAGGYSARAFLDRLEGFVIGVNDAGIRAKTDAIISMDRLWAENRWGELLALRRPTWLRRHPPLPDGGPDWLQVFACDHTSTTLSLEPGVLNGTHSGFCALNLAFHMRPKRLILVGMDMEKGPNGEHHWFPPYPWAPNGATTSGKFKVWSDQFQTAFGQLRASGAKIEIWGKSAIREKP